MSQVQRIRGQEVKVYFNTNEGQNQSLLDIRSFSITPKFTKLEEQYLGETSKRYDEMFDGVDFDMELHVEDPGVLDFISFIRRRAVLRANSATAGLSQNTYVNIVATLNFIGGAKEITLQDCYFENMPLNVGSRSDYVTFKLAGSCTDFFVNQ